MARLIQILDSSADAETSGIFDAIRRKIGMVPNLYRVAANRPAVLRALLSANDSLSGGSFDAHTREAIALAVAKRNACDYCASAHSAIAAGLKIDADTIRDHLAGHAADARLQAILTLAVAIVDRRGRLADSELGTARAAGLSDADIVEILGNVVVNIFTNYLNHAADTDIDFPVVTAGDAAA